MKQTRFFDVFQIDKRRLATKNLTPRKKFFDEELTRKGGVEYRVWDPTRSKLAAAVMKNISQIGIREGCAVLYLGASHGYTPSFVSDIVGKGGFVFCVDFAPRVVRDLVFICEQRENMAPILGNSNMPETYLDKVSQVDVVYQDIAQRNQVDIFLKNCELFLKPNGYALLCVKARSIDVSKKPKELFKSIRTELENSFLTVADYRELEPFEKDHAIFVCKNK